MKLKTSIYLALMGLGLTASAQAATFVWDGGATGNWKTAANWDPDGSPGTDDTATIGATSTVTFDGGGNLPLNLTLNLDGTLTNSGQGAIRTAGGTINVSSTGEIAGDFWDLRNATIVFEDGATYSANDWENKDTNVFIFNLKPRPNC